MAPDEIAYHETVKGRVLFNDMIMKEVHDAMEQPERIVVKEEPRRVMSDQERMELEQ